MPRPMLKQVDRRREVLKDATIREFNGGLNVIDNDLNLSTEYAKTLDNMYRAPDGTVSIRYGTTLFADVANQSATAGTFATDPLTTTAASNVITIELTGHGLLSGHTITIAGAGAFDGIPAIEINTTHTVTVVDADNFTVTVTTNASAGLTGGGSSITYSHNNKELTGDIVNMVYFQDHIVVVDDNGEIAKVDSSGVSTVIFNTALANALSGSPSAWNAMTFCSFAVFGGDLIVCNGQDKPLLINFDVTIPALPVQYLQDLGSGSNVNTPIAKYVMALDHYVIMAGDPLDPGLVHISNYDTSGTWLNDGAPNDAVQVELSKVTTSTEATIRGISRFRDNVIVAFDDNLVIGSVGIYTGTASDVHSPDFGDVVEQHGSLSHRSMQSLGDDLLMCDVAGVPSLKRTILADSLRPERASELIDPLIQAQIIDLSIFSSEERIFSVYNQKEGQYMLFIPNGNTIGTTTETTCYAYTVIKSLKIKAWSRFTGWNWSCACRSQLNRVFFAENAGSKLYVYGSENDPSHGDKIGDSAISDPTNGDDIAFDWEMPWADFNIRAFAKRSRYIGFDTKGTARFTAKMYIDNIELDALSADNPTLMMEFVGGDSPGFGGGMQPYGAGRRTSDERLWSWPTKFKIAKLRFTGSTTEELKFVSITLLYKDGSIRR